MHPSAKTYFFILAAIALLTSGCATTVEPYDYTAFKESKPRSILVMPPTNNSVEVNAPYIYLSTITQPLAEKGYYVFPVFLIDRFLKENGLPTPMEMQAIPLDKITEHIGADTVLYVAIEDWGQKFEILQSVTRVKAALKLVDVKTGKLLWESHAIAEEASGDAGGGLAGALISAIVTQVMASTIFDKTPLLSHLANDLAINHETRGMLNGPYKPTKTPD